MATVASRQQFSTAPSNTQSHYRTAASAGTQHVQHATHGVFTSPTESEFSESYQDPRAISAQEWDESKVGEWLRGINCSQYVELFRRNHITGENLMEMDQPMLKEIGVKKIGDRVRLGTQVKALRNSTFKRYSKRSQNRESLAIMDGNAQHTPPSSASPRGFPRAVPGKNDRQLSRQYSGDVKMGSRPASPMVDQENRMRVRNGMPSPLDSNQPPTSAKYTVLAPRMQNGETPQTARFASTVRQQPSLNNINTTNVIGALPNDQPLIRVIYDNGTSSVVNIAGFRNAEDIVRTSLKNGALNENHVRSYCFYVLDGTDPDPAFCRRVSEVELVRLCNDRVRNERGRLLLRKIHAGTPEGEQLKLAARVAEQQLPSPPAIEVQMPPKRGQLKIDQVTPLPAHSYPMSPASQEQRNQYFETQSNLSRNVSVSTTASARARKLKDFYGARPPTELISQDLQSYFPEVAKDDMDRTVRMSVRRSIRMSKALSRLSIASNFSINSLIDKNVPPIPSVADTWLSGPGSARAVPRPLSIARLPQTRAGYRDSVASSMLEPLDEESSFEPNRKSYVSFSGDDVSTSNLSITDPEGNTVMQSYYDDNNSNSPANTEGGGSINSRLSQFIAEDGEEPDEELMQHLEKDSWDDLKYMKGSMIGQGSFGTVFLALHAVTAALMAVKQVEMPSSQGTAMDAKKNNMIEALKHEISLLKQFKHPNIVQYLGSNSDDQHLNIFLEYVAGGSVATMLVEYGTFNELLIYNFVRQILEGLNYLHSQDVIHRDIKGANILVDHQGTVKISDFGISKRVEASTFLSNAGPKSRGPRVSLQGSVFWMAPEVVRQTAYTKKADIWSLGCLIVEMFTGSHPHPNCTQLQALFKIGHSGADAEAAKPELPEVASKEAKEFLTRTFEYEHEKRPTAAELLVSDFCLRKGVQEP